MAANMMIARWVRKLDQEKVDAWMAGRISVTEKVQALLDQYPKMAKSSKGSLERYLRDMDGSGIYRWLRENRPDLRLGEEAAAAARIDADLEQVRRLVAAL